MPAGAVLERPKQVILTKVEVEPKLGGEGSGFPPRFLIATGALGHSIIGIDLGAHWTSVATVVGDQPKLIVTPISSCIRKFTDDATRIRSLDEPISTESLVSLIGSDADLSEAWRISTNAANRELQDQYVERLLYQSQMHAENLIKKCVVAVPASLGAEKRRLLKELLEDCGLEVLNLINEHTAATLAYVYESGLPDGLVLVFSIGATHSVASLIEVHDGILETRATSTDGSLGSEDFDAVIIDWIYEQFKKQYTFELARTAENLTKLRSIALQAKKDLMMAPQTYMAIGGLQSNQSKLDFNQYYISLKLSRSEFDGLSRHLLDKVTQLIRNVLLDCHLRAEDLRQILLVGQESEIPVIHNELKTMAPPGWQPLTHSTGLHATAHGAAIHASVLTRNMKDLIVWDALTIPIWVELPDGSCKQIISSGTPLPITAYHRIESTTPTVNLHVLQGHSPLTSENVSLAEITVNNCPPTTSADTKVEVAIMVRADGTTEFSARHVQLQVNLPLTILRGQATSSNQRILSLVPNKEDSRTADPDRVARLCRKLNMSKKEALTILQSLGYSRKEIESGTAVELVIFSLSKKRKKKKEKREE